MTPFDLSAFFIDPDSTDTLSYSADPTDLPPGLVLDPVTGIISGIPDANASQGGPGSDGVYVISVTADDGNGGTFTTNVTYTISNPAPIAQDDAVSGGEDAVSNGDLFAGNGNGVDSDPDGDTFTVSEVNGATGNVSTPTSGDNGGSFTINFDGTYSFDPSGDFDDLAVGDTRDTTITYTIDDGEGGTDTATVTLTVAGANDAPVPVDPTDPSTPPANPNNYIPAQIGDDSDPVIDFDLTPYFGDPDSSDTLTISINPADLPPGLSFNPATGILSGTPDAGASQGGPSSDGVYVIPVTVDDGNGGTFTTNVTYTISNPAPTAQDDAVSGGEDAVSTGDLFADNGNGADNDPDGDVLIVSEVNGVPANVNAPTAGDNGGLFTINPDGTYSFDPNGEFDDLAVGETRITTIAYTIDDGEGGTDTATVTLTVTGTNDAPIAQPDSETTDEDTAISIGVASGLIDPNDTDTDASDTLTVSEVNGDPAVIGAQVTLPSGALLTVNPDGSFDYDPNGSFENLNAGDATTD